MKRIHLILLIVAAITAVSSVYSLAAMNQVYRVGFAWYSEYQNKFVSDKRDSSKDHGSLDEYPDSMRIEILSDLTALNENEGKGTMTITDPAEVDSSKYLFVYCTLGKITSPEYRIKVEGIAQRGDVVEVIVSVNSPDKDALEGESLLYTPMDIIRVEKDAFPIKGKLLFVFKNQNGIQLGKQYYEVR